MMSEVSVIEITWSIFRFDGFSGLQGQNGSHQPNFRNNEKTLLNSLLVFIAAYIVFESIASDVASQIELRAVNESIHSDSPRRISAATTLENKSIEGTEGNKHQIDTLLCHDRS